MLRHATPKVLTIDKPETLGTYLPTVRPHLSLFGSCLYSEYDDGIHVWSRT